MRPALITDTTGPVGRKGTSKGRDSDWLCGMWVCKARQCSNRLQLVVSHASVQRPTFSSEHAQALSPVLKERSASLHRMLSLVPAPATGLTGGRLTMASAPQRAGHRRVCFKTASFSLVSPDSKPPFRFRSGAQFLPPSFAQNPSCRINGGVLSPLSPDWGLCPGGESSGPSALLRSLTRSVRAVKGTLAIFKSSEDIASSCSLLRTSAALRAEIVPFQTFSLVLILSGNSLARYVCIHS